MSKVLVTESSLARIAAAIRAKNGSSDTYKPGQMAEAIEAIPQYADTSDATAAAGDILASKTAYIADGKTTGAMPENGAVAGVIDGDNPSYTIPAGHHNGSGTVSADVATTQEVLDFLDTYPTVDEKTITENGTYAASSDNLHGYSSVTVNVPGGGAVVPLADNLYTTSGSFTYSKTITIQEAGSYTIAVQAYSNNLTVKINDTAQSLVIEKPGDYMRLYKATVSLSVGDVIDIYATSSGWSSVTAFIIKDQ